MVYIVMDKWAVGLVIGLCAILVWRFLLNTTRTLPLPPGPSPLPLIGNILDVPKKSQWLTYGKLASIYGMLPARLHASVHSSLMFLFDARR